MPSSLPSTRRPPAWDGVQVLTVVAANRGSLSSLWGLCKEVDAVAGRRVNLPQHYETPNSVQQRILKMLKHQQRGELQGGQGASPRHFRVTAASLGFGFGTTKEGIRLAQEGLRVLPGSVKDVRLEGYFNSPDLRFPDWLEVLQFCGGFDQPVALPPSLRKVKFGHWFNQCGVVLPESLEEVEFGSAFDQAIALPSSLRKATFGIYFNQRNVLLPDSLEELAFGYYFDEPITLPSSLRKIKFSECSAFNQPLALASCVSSDSGAGEEVHAASTGSACRPGEAEVWELL